MIPRKGLKNLILLYTGTPGSGKSYHAAVKVLEKTKQKKNNKVIANFLVNIPNQENFIFIETMKITPEYLIDFAKKNHVAYKESQTLIIIDEAQLIFNSREWNSAKGNRMDWISFFSQHRHYGYNIILVTQNDRMIDRQIRSLVEYEIAHLKVGNYFRFLPFTAFMAVQRWYGQKLKMGHEMLIYRKKIANIYNTFATFGEGGDMGFPTKSTKGAKVEERKIISLESKTALE